jgi:dephospho-CoA kinase
MRKKKKFLIGLTGNIASGKSTVAKILNDNGLPIIEADRIGWEILERKEIKGEIIRNVENVLKNGKIDRKKLGKIVFSDRTKLKAFNAIIHPPLIQKLKWEIENTANNTVVVNAALIFEWGIEHWFSKIILVTSYKKHKVARLRKNGFSRKEARDRIESQMPDREIIEKCDFVIKNNGTLEELKNQTLSILKLLQPHLQ